MAEEDRRNNDKEIVPDGGSALEPSAQFRLGADNPDLARWRRRY
jgi:hypothetical protein